MQGVRPTPHHNHSYKKNHNQRLITFIHAGNSPNTSSHSLMQGVHPTPHHTHSCREFTQRLITLSHAGNLPNASLHSLLQGIHPKPHYNHSCKELDQRLTTLTHARNSPNGSSHSLMQGFHPTPNHTHPCKELTQRLITLTHAGQFGPPSFSVAATIGFLAATMASMVESVGDYYAAAKCCNVMTPPDHAMSRGILVEGIGSCMSGAVGAAHATTSYSGNIAMLSLTQVLVAKVSDFTSKSIEVLELFSKLTHSPDRRGYRVRLTRFAHTPSPHLSC